MACIRKRSDKWQCQVRRKGFAPRAKSFSQRKDAERWGLLQEREIDLLESRGLRHAPKPTATLTLKEALERSYERARKGSGESYLLRAMAQRPFAKKALSDFTAEDFVAYRDGRRKEVGPTTVARELWLLKRTFELARTEWGCSTLANPAQLVSRPRLPRGRERRLLAGEEERLVDLASQCPWPQLARLIRFGLATAMRRGEMLSLKWANCDLANRTALLPKTKNGRARTVPLSAAAMKVLAESGHEPEGLVFPISPEQARKAWALVLQRLGVEDLHFHDLRHEAISRLFEHGLEMPHVMMISGHTDPRALLRYTHLHARKLVEKLDRL